MEYLEDIWFWILDFIDDHTTGVKIFGISTIVAIIVGVAAYIIIDPIKIVWVGEDTNLVATSSSELRYGAIAKNRKSNNYPVEYDVSAGEVVTDDDGNIIWKLPVEE